MIFACYIFIIQVVFRSLISFHSSLSRKIELFLKRKRFNLKFVSFEEKVVTPPPAKGEFLDGEKPIAVVENYRFLL